VENGLEGVVILSDVSMTADGFSTAVFGLGLEAGLALANSFGMILRRSLSPPTSKVYLSDGIAAEFRIAR
jgi:thiamine biosynthesis lipoprotein ApbE